MKSTAWCFDFDRTLTEVFSDIELERMHDQALQLLSPMVRADLLDSDDPYVVWGEVRARASSTDHSEWRHAEQAIRGFLAENERLRAATVQPFDGVVEVLTELRARGACIGVVSSNDHVLISAALERWGLTSGVDSVIGRRPEDRSADLKPFPIPLLTCLQRLDAAPRDAKYVGDSPDDAECAKRAGVQFIGVTSGKTDARTLVSAGATEVVNSLRQLLDRG